MVFLLVEHEMLCSQEEDSIDDFDGGFDFDEVFVEAYEPVLPATLDGLGGADSSESALDA